VTLEHCRERGKFPGLRVLREVIDLQLLRAEPHALRNAPGKDPDADARVTQEVDAEAVLNVVALELDARAVDITEVDAAVGEHAVDVEADEADAARERGVERRARGQRGHRRQRSQTSTARSTSSSR
jgi:hypothetical protein